MNSCIPMEYGLGYGSPFKMSFQEIGNRIIKGDYHINATDIRIHLIQNNNMAIMGGSVLKKIDYNQLSEQLGKDRHQPIAG